MFLSNKCDQRLKAAFELYNQQLSDNLPNKDELKTITFSQTFETKMKKLLAAQKKSYYYMINTVGKRIAIIITALLITLIACFIKFAACIIYGLTIICCIFFCISFVNMSIKN